MSEDGRLRIDDYLTENAIGTFFIRSKNFLSCDTVAGANASANPCILIALDQGPRREPAIQVVIG